MTVTRIGCPIVESVGRVHGLEGEKIAINYLQQHVLIVVEMILAYYSPRDPISYLQPVP